MYPIRGNSHVFLTLLLGVMVLLTISGICRAAAPFLEDIRNGQQKTIVMMGTSLTDGMIWVDEMEAWLKSEATNSANVDVYNVAIGGQSSVGGITDQLPLAKAANPDVVFIEYAINDAYTPYSVTLQDSKDNLNYIIDELQAQNPDVEIVLETMNNPDGDPLADRPDYAAYYQGYRDIAQARGLILIDHLPNWLDLYNTDPTTWHAYVTDGVHPHGAAANAMILQEIQDTLNAPEPGTMVLLVLGGCVLLRRRGR